MRRSLLISALVSILATGLVLLSPPQTAHAVLDQICLVNETVTYNPPITNQQQTVTITVNGNLYLCTSSSASTGSYIEQTTTATSCTALFNSVSASRVLNWTNPAIADSTFTYNRSSQRVNGNVQVTFLGEISSGTFTPDPAQKVIAAPETNLLACSGTGISQLTFNGALTIGLV